MEKDPKIIKAFLELKVAILRAFWVTSPDRRKPGFGKRLMAKVRKLRNQAASL
jgi:hypothetical protein